MISNLNGDKLLNKKGEWGQNLPPVLVVEDQRDEQKDREAGRDHQETETGKRRAGPTVAPGGHQVKKRSRLVLEHTDEMPQITLKLPENNLHQDADADAGNRVRKSKVPVSLRSEVEQTQTSKPLTAI